MQLSNKWGDKFEELVRGVGKQCAACGVRHGVSRREGVKASGRLCGYAGYAVIRLCGYAVMQVNVTLGLAQLQDCRTARLQDRKTMYYRRRAAGGYGSFRKGGTGQICKTCLTCISSYQKTVNKKPCEKHDKICPHEPDCKGLEKAC